MSSSSTHPKGPQAELTLIGTTIKPFGLTGEIKVRPESFDIHRHNQLSEVVFKKHPKAKPINLKVAASRLQGNFWHLKFENYLTPEAVKEFSGGLLFVEDENRLELPEDMIYTSDVIGFRAVDMEGKDLGEIVEILEYPNQDLIKIHPVNPDHKEYLVPWVEAFVKKVDEENQQMHIQFDLLEGLYEN